MRAGKMTSFLTVMKRTEEEDPVSGVVKPVWVQSATVRAERQSATYRTVVKGSETYETADAVFIVRFAHDIRTGDRVVERRFGELFDVTVEPNREKDLKTLKCTLVND